MELNSGPPGRQVGLKKHALQKILWTKIMDILSGRDTGNDFFVPQIPGGSGSIPGTLNVV